MVRLCYVGLGLSVNFPCDEFTVNHIHQTVSSIPLDVPAQSDREASSSQQVVWPKLRNFLGNLWKSCHCHHYAICIEWWNASSASLHRRELDGNRQARHFDKHCRRIGSPLYAVVPVAPSVSQPLDTVVDALAASSLERKESEALEVHLLDGFVLIFLRVS